MPGTAKGREETGVAAARQPRDSEPRGRGGIGFADSEEATAGEDYGMQSGCGTSTSQHGTSLSCLLGDRSSGRMRRRGGREEKENQEGGKREKGRKVVGIREGGRNEGRDGGERNRRWEEGMNRGREGGRNRGREGRGGGTERGREGGRASARAPEVSRAKGV